MTSTTDPRALKRKDQQDKARKFRQDQDFRWVLGRPEGRRSLQGILDALGINGELPVGSAQAHAAIGCHNFGVTLRRLIRDVPGVDQHVLSIMEAEFDAPAEVPSGGVDDVPGGVITEPPEPEGE